MQADTAALSEMIGELFGLGKLIPVVEHERACKVCLDVLINENYYTVR